MRSAVQQRRSNEMQRWTTALAAVAAWCLVLAAASTVDAGAKGATSASASINDLASASEEKEGRSVVLADYRTCQQGYRLDRRGKCRLV